MLTECRVQCGGHRHTRTKTRSRTPPPHPARPSFSHLRPPISTPLSFLAAPDPQTASMLSYDSLECVFPPVRAHTSTPSHADVPLHSFMPSLALDALPNPVHESCAGPFFDPYSLEPSQSFEFVRLSSPNPPTMPYSPHTPSAPTLPAAARSFPTSTTSSSTSRKPTSSRSTLTPLRRTSSLALNPTRLSLCRPPYRTLTRTFPPALSPPPPQAQARMQTLHAHLPTSASPSASRLRSSPCSPHSRARGRRHHYSPNTARQPVRHGNRPLYPSGHTRSRTRMHPRVRSTRTSHRGARLDTRTQRIPSPSPLRPKRSGRSHRNGTRATARDDATGARRHTSVR